MNPPTLPVTGKGSQTGRVLLRRSGTVPPLPWSTFAPPLTASWANLVERFFGILTQKQIRRGVFTSVPHLEKCLREYLESYNENPRALVWTKSVEEILEKVRRGRAELPKTT